ncbi:hypothetical protein RGQ15_11220 [Paracoccus sp. MBLB3053]|uniref:Uncharacterized protein n=1 Tax=Paracoccus aurantius TaxID=3073814 RepID=A0ABU2HSX5_9RHOB|nr:hypothetical protein [Paracoccus sp. MBLB3053]MDS9468136.1 hypothetical protein [Paracoccus sp. MBLB3053]
MTEAKLSFEDGPALSGMATHGGDYVTFKTETSLDQDQLQALKAGVVEISGKTEKVFVESVRVSGTEADGCCLEITLRLYAPITG